MLSLMFVKSGRNIFLGISVAKFYVASLFIFFMPIFFSFLKSPAEFFSQLFVTGPLKTFDVAQNVVKKDRAHYFAFDNW